MLGDQRETDDAVLISLGGDAKFQSPLDVRQDGTATRNQESRT